MGSRESANKNRPKSRAGKTQNKTLGPVDDLEEHVNPDWWSRIFNSLYLKTDADVVNDLRITHQEVSLIMKILNFTPDQRILDLCCGQGRHTIELARRGFTNVEGIDRSHYLIQKARERAKSESLPVKFREGDARRLPYPPDTFDVVLLLGNSFGYFETLQDDLRVLKQIVRALKPWGKILIDIADGEYLKKNYQPRSWEWIDNRFFVCRERSLSLDESRLVSREVITNVDKGVVADQFYAERLYSKNSLCRILDDAGYSDISSVAEFSPDSVRGQDLGMMERRIIITACVRKEWTPDRRKQKQELKHIAVVLGDPRKPDQLKPQCVFDDDDLYTIDRMKSALRELPGYRFTYIDNHDNLIQDLSRLIGRADLVMNLCDEGYQNEPRKELHVPVLLETLGLPYTGSGPQCLAYCYDKSLTRGIAEEMGVPVSRAFFIKPEDSTFELPFDFPVIVKPNFGDSSFGITRNSVADTAEELINAVLGIREQFGYTNPMLVEEFLTGSDLTVGIIGNFPSSYTVLPLSEEDYSELPPELPPICGYEAKWCPESPYWRIESVPARLPVRTQNAIVQWCVQLAERLECRDYVRFDWRLDAKGAPKLLEVNPNPGWCWDGHLAKMAGYIGMSYPDMLKAIINAAEQRLGLGTTDEANGRTLGCAAEAKQEPCK